MARQKIDPIERFKTKYVVDPVTGCWNWQGCLDEKGYGRFGILPGKNIKAHRYSYEIFVGKLDNNLKICHSCNNRKCINPEHLRQDTISSNAIDMIYSKNGNFQILSIDEVIEIKKELKHHYRGQCKDLAHFYKVETSTISAIKTGRSWSHVEVD